MIFLPFQILAVWLRGLLAVAILVGGIYALHTWYENSIVLEADPVAMSPDERVKQGPDRQPAVEVIRIGKPRRVFHFDPGWNRTTAWLVGSLALLTLASVGQRIGGRVSRLTAKQPQLGAQSHPTEDPREERTGESHRIQRPDGTDLFVECYGPADAPPIVFTHGWGSTGTEWFYQKKHLADRYRLILWDEPGLGLSGKPANNDFSMEKMAADLEAVLAFAGPSPAVLVGHSIGGMILLTFCRLFPEAMKQRVAGLMLVHTTYTNPVRTTSMGALYTILEKPLLVPLLYLTIGTWPVVWVMNWLSYFNGSLNRSTRKTSFAGTQTEGQVDFVARGLPQCRPDILARGMLGMIRFDASDVLSRVAVPTLVVNGDKDTTTLPEAGQHMARTIPNAKLATLTPARHMGLLEHHAEFNELVSGFVDACETQRGQG